MSAIIERPLREHLRVEVLDPATPFVLGASFLNDAALGDSSSVPIWSDWAADATTVSIRRGGDRDGIGVAMTPGLSTVTLYGFSEPDPSAPVFVADRRLRIVQTLAGGDHPLYAGRVREVALAYVRPASGGRHVPVTTLTLVDAVADHEQVTRAGALPASGSETFGQRIRRLSASSVAPIEQPAVATYHDLSSNEILLGRTVHEGPLAEHFTIACATVGAIWWVGGDGVTRFAPRQGAGYPESPAAVFWFDGYAGDKPADALHGIDAELAAGSRVTFTVGIAHDLGAVEDPENAGSWIAADEDYLYREPLPAMGADTRLGRSPVTTTINTANSVVHRLWEQQISYADGSPHIVSLIWNAQEDLSRIPDLEIGNVLRVHHPAVGAAGVQIVGVQHTITPTRWMVQLSLIPGALYS